ncbi:hypothetical protein [Paraburkholderia mimosarum]|uniref:hypothetical protein n=1 Tax=Paraburkholderia mimosarum TaxID=312026 RepID=UPI001FC870E8|nr:hypothetical protein [Paraburkholderia mimosarum]
MVLTRGRVDAVELEKYRSVDCEVLLPLLADYVKADASFVPIRDSHTHRWHLRVGDNEFELLTTGPKWFDTRRQRGGGGGIDLAMHLLALDFRQAVRKLRQVM